MRESDKVSPARVPKTTLSANPASAPSAVVHVACARGAESPTKAANTDDGGGMRNAGISSARTMSSQAETTMTSVTAGGTSTLRARVVERAMFLEGFVKDSGLLCKAELGA